MKAGTDDKNKTRTAIVLFVLALLVVAYELWPSGSSEPAPTSTTSTSAPSSADKGKRSAAVFSRLDPSLRTDLLKGAEEVTYTGSGRDIFHNQAPPPPQPEVVAADDPRVRPPAPVTPAEKPKPPIPLKFYGFASENNKKQIFLAQGEDIFVAREGDIIKGRYKVLKVGTNNVEIQDVLADYSQSIPLTLPNS